jgi:hypothetical protein
MIFMHKAVGLTAPGITFCKLFNQWPFLAKQQMFQSLNTSALMRPLCYGYLLFYPLSSNPYAHTRNVFVSLYLPLYTYF